MKNKALEEQLRLATAGREVGRRDTLPGDRKGGESLVLGDSIIRNVGTECSEMKVECFPDISCIQLLKIETWGTQIPSLSMWVQTI
jgi:hypothetical protein